MMEVSNQENESSMCELDLQLSLSLKVVVAYLTRAIIGGPIKWKMFILKR